MDVVPDGTESVLGPWAVACCTGMCKCCIFTDGLSIGEGFTTLKSLFSSGRNGVLYEGS